MQSKRFFLFFVVSFIFFVAWMEVKNRIWPPPPPEELAENDKDKKKTKDKKQTKDKQVAVKDKDKTPKAEPKGPGAWQRLAKHIPKNPPTPFVVSSSGPTPDADCFAMGAPERDSRFHLNVLLDPKGASVRSVLLNKFQAMDAQGRPIWRDKKAKIPEPLELVPSDANRTFPSYVLYHYAFDQPSNDRPLATLGQQKWTLDEDRSQTVQVGTADGVYLQQRIAFVAEVDGVEFTKVFTLTEGEYHIGLEVHVRKTERANLSKNAKIRYQLAGAHGLPIEGQWYTSVFRNALIAEEVLGEDSIYRDLQDLRQISVWGGGKEVVPEGDRILRYAGVAIQYFASVITVDNRQAKQNFLAKARPTLEQYIVKATLKDKGDPSRIVMKMPFNEKEETFYVPEHLQSKIEQLEPDAKVALTVYTDFHRRQVVTNIGSDALTQPLFENDITVRVTTVPLELEEDDEIVHRYLLYNGPVKASLLAKMDGVASVPPSQIERYVDVLHLNTLTDYHSPGFMGSFANKIYWTDVIIKFTNLMHTVLGWIQSVIPNAGLAIICLTVLVRLMLFPLSRKQAYMTIKMQELAPEMKKIQEKHKDDRQAQGMAQMELYRKHGVNPLGTCWLLLLQMPIFMGLYYSLQESIFFRLAEFWPTWIVNLAGPDMLFRWGDSIPMLSRPQDYGGLLYLGPFFNILPLIAVSLMLVQQKMMTPPPTDEQQAMQQKIMKYMMVFFGLIFFKIAAGLCLYFIASTLWGVVERKLLPKKDDAKSADKPEEETSPSGEKDANATNGAPSGRKAGRNKKRQERVVQTRTPAEPEPEDESTLGRIRSWWRARKQRISNWWAEVLEEAKKKN